MYTVAAVCQHAMLQQVCIELSINSLSHVPYVQISKKKKGDLDFPNDAHFLTCRTLSLPLWMTSHLTATPDIRGPTRPAVQLGWRMNCPHPLVAWGWWEAGLEPEVLGTCVCVCVCVFVCCVCVFVRYCTQL